MRNSKLYSVLKEFDKYEQNRCRKYIQSPYFNRSEKIAELYEFFIGKVNEGEEEDFTKESIWEVLHSGTELNSDRWRKYCSDLLKLVEGYLIQEEFEKDKQMQSFYLMEGVSKRELKSIIANSIKKAENNIKKYPFKDADYYRLNYLAEKQKYKITQFDKQRSATSNIETILNRLDLFYLSEKLKFYCNVLSRQSTVSHKYEVELIPQILDHLRNSDYSMFPSVSIYYQIILAMSEEKNEAHYFKLKELLSNHSTSFPKNEASDMYTFAVNYCTRKLNSGNQSFWREYFDIHKQLLDNRIIIVNNELSVGIFKNIVAAGLRLGEIKWTENFINEYGKYLPEERRDNALTFNLAQVYFFKKEFDKVIDMLQQVEYEDFIYNYNAKQLLLKTYYETNEIEPLYSLFDSFRAYLYRQKNISDKLRQSFSNFITMTKRLIRIEKHDIKSLVKLKKEVDNTKNVGNLAWLKEKIAEKE